MPKPCFSKTLADVVRQALPISETLRANRIFSVGKRVDGFESFEDLLAKSPRSPRKVKDAGTKDAAVIIYTSGTTGKPKGAVRTFPTDIVEGTLQLILTSPPANERHPPSSTAFLSRNRLCLHEPQPPGWSQGGDHGSLEPTDKALSDTKLPRQ